MHTAGAGKGILEAWGGGRDKSEKKRGGDALLVDFTPCRRAHTHAHAETDRQTDTHTHTQTHRFKKKSKASTEMSACMPRAKQKRKKGGWPRESQAERDQS